MVAVLGDKFSLPRRSIFRDIELVRSGGKVCVRYKGKLFTNLDQTPILSKLMSMPQVEQKLSQEVFGPSPPNLFVGEFGYPNVSVGPLVSVDENADAEFLDSPRRWNELGYDQIIQMRISLVRGKRLNRVSEETRYLQEVQEAVMSREAVDLEVSFTRKPSFSAWFSPQSQPMGPAGDVKRIELAGNPSIPSIVDEVVEDKLLVSEAVPELLAHGLDYYYVQKLFSAGVLGRARKLVPTKWSITGADDIIARHLLAQVRESAELGEFLIFKSDLLFNHFEVLLIPGKWEFENFEAWAPSTPWAEQSSDGIIGEYEPFAGRSSYAELQGGGYYASRLGVVEALARMGRQARAVVFREVGEGYQVPVGVWQVRENVRQALATPPAKCSSLGDALSLLATRLRHPIGEYIKRSRILAQRRMQAWF